MSEGGRGSKERREEAMERGEEKGNKRMKMKATYINYKTTSLPLNILQSHNLY